MLPIRHLSYSSINTYMLCARSWFYRYVEKPEVPVAAALPFGSAIHKAVQTYITTKILHPGEVQPLRELWSTCWQDALAERKQEIDWDKPKSHYTLLGDKMLRTPSITNAIDAIQPLALAADDDLVEHRIEFTVPGVPVPIIGYIDVIVTDGIPVDFKTAGRKWASGKEHTESQPNFYLAALNHAGFDDNPDNKFRYYILTKTKSPICQVLETSRTWEQLLWTFQTIRQVWDAISAGSFSPNVSGWKCSEKFCSYWNLCRGK